ncbi:MAG: SAM-dependent chlorinase/fluorinase [Chloroflexi bacterium]|nr:MAG: SAM-dependent chlorinase/fluorinase [Chloroflexota bacterium]
MRRPIVFVTDYGRDDTYAAALVGSVLRVVPGVQCIEGTHGVPAGDVLAGAYHLKALALAFEKGVVFCAVVDPDVGTARRCIAIDTGELICVAPDNGLVSYLWAESSSQMRRAVALLSPAYAWPTFHGRDIFAPAAAQLADGLRLEDSGEPIRDPVVLREAFAEPLGTGLRGRVAVIDHFGNAITTIRAVDIRGRRIGAVSWAGGATAQSASTYDDIAPATLAAVVGSAGHVEIAARRAPASTLGGPTPGADVALELA